MEEIPIDFEELTENYENLENYLEEGGDPNAMWRKPRPLRVGRHGRPIRPEEPKISILEYLTKPTQSRKHEKILDMIEILLKYGADPDATSSRFIRVQGPTLAFTPLMIAKDFPVLELLLNGIKINGSSGYINKADVNYITDGVGTALHDAILSNDLEKINFLLENGADPNMKAKVLWYPDQLLQRILDYWRRPRVRQPAGFRRRPLWSLFRHVLERSRSYLEEKSPLEYALDLGLTDSTKIMDNFLLGKTIKSRQMLAFMTSLIGENSAPNDIEDLSNIGEILSNYIIKHDPEVLIRSNYQDNYDSDGYDIDGYDPNGYDIDGYDPNGYDIDGYDPNGYDPNGYDPNGYDTNGYDPNGYDPNGYDTNGYDIYGYDPNGYDTNGYYDFSIGDNVEWKDKKGKVYTGIIKAKTKNNYLICCKKGSDSRWHVPINLPSLKKVVQDKYSYVSGLDNMMKTPDDFYGGYLNIKRGRTRKKGKTIKRGGTRNKGKTIKKMSKEIEVFRIIPTIGECYETIESTRSTGPWDNKKYYSTLKSRYVGKFLRSEPIMQMGEPSQVYIFYNDITNTEDTLRLSYEGTTCFMPVECKSLVKRKQMLAFSKSLKTNTKPTKELEDMSNIMTIINSHM